MFDELTFEPSDIGIIYNINIFETNQIYIIVPYA